MIDERTASLELPLPHAANTLEEDLPRLRTAFGLIDARFASLAVLLASDDTTLDTVLEMVAAIKENRDDIAAILLDKVGTDAFTAALAGKEPANANLQAHVASLANPHATTKAQVGLGNCDNTADAAKPVSAAQQTALDGKLALYTTTTTAVSKTLANRERCAVTAAGQTITLPATPQAGWEVAVGVGAFTDTILARNGENIMGLAEDMTLNEQHATVTLYYVDATRGWRLI